MTGLHFPGSRTRKDELPRTCMIGFETDSVPYSRCILPLVDQPEAFSIQYCTRIHLGKNLGFLLAQGLKIENARECISPVLVFPQPFGPTILTAPNVCNLKFSSTSMMRGLYDVSI